MIDYTSYKLEDANETLVVEVTGKLDSSTSTFLLDCIQGFIDRGDHKIVLDCSELGAINSEGLAALVRANKRLKERGGRISLAGVHGTVATVLQLVHFDRLFGMYSTVNEAANAFE